MVLFRNRINSIGINIRNISKKIPAVIKKATPLVSSWMLKLYIAIITKKDKNTVAAKMPGVGLNCLIAGGVAYTVGAVLYGLGKKVPYMHAVWHLFVLAGSVLHTLSVFTVII